MKELCPSSFAETGDVFMLSFFTFEENAEILKMSFEICIFLKALFFSLILFP